MMKKASTEVISETAYENQSSNGKNANYSMKKAYNNLTIKVDG